MKARKVSGLMVTLQKGRSKLLLALFIGAIAFPLFSQTGRTNPGSAANKNTSLFVKTVHSTGTLVQTIQDTRDGFVSISGPESQNSSRTFLVRRVKSSGEPTWETTLDFPRSFFIFLEAIAETTDGGYILVGFSRVFDFYYYTFRGTAIAVKLRSNGSPQWGKSFSATNSNFTNFSSVVSLPDGGFVASGRTSSGQKGAQLLVRFTSIGDILWSKSFEKLVDEFQLLRNDNGFILAANIPNGAQMIKLDHQANVVWAKSFKTPGSVFQTAKVAADGGIVLAGCKSNQLSLIRLANDGKVTWTAKYVVQTHAVNSISDLIQTSDSGYAITGTLRDGESFQNRKAFLLKLDSSRNIVFQETFTPGRVDGGSVFNVGKTGYMLFRAMEVRPAGGQAERATLISKVNGEGIVPGCTSFYSLPTTSTTFGELSESQIQIKDPVNSSLGINSLAVNFAPSNLTVSTVCQ